MTGHKKRILPKNSPPAFFTAPAGAILPRLAPAVFFDFGGGSPPSLHTSGEPVFGFPMMKDERHALEEARAIALVYPSPWAKKEIVRRRKILAGHRRLIASGMSVVAAARKLRTSPATIWRWRKRIAPDTFRCGRPSPFKQAQVPAEIIDVVQRAQLTGISNIKAWRGAANEPTCPPALAEFLRVAQTIPPSFLRATRLLRLTVTVKVIKGARFTVMESYEPKVSNCPRTIPGAYP
jgi:hypothetical protein